MRNQPGERKPPAFYGFVPGFPQPRTIASERGALSPAKRERRAGARKTMSDQAPSAPPESFDAFQRRVIEIEPQLPKRLRQAAAYALEHPENSRSARPRRSPATPRCRPRPWCASPRRWGSPASPSCRSCSARACATVARLFRAPQGAAAAPGQRDPTHLLFGFADSAAASIARLRDNVQNRELDRAVELLTAARTIHCLGQRRSSASPII